MISPFKVGRAAQYAGPLYGLSPLSGGDLVAVRENDDCCERSHDQCVHYDVRSRAVGVGD